MFFDSVLIVVVVVVAVFVSFWICSVTIIAAKWINEMHRFYLFLDIFIIYFVSYLDSHQKGDTFKWRRLSYIDCRDSTQSMSLYLFVCCALNCFYYYILSECMCRHTKRIAEILRTCFVKTHIDSFDLLYKKYFRVHWNVHLNWIRIGFN